MMLKVKLLAALAAITSMECVAPNVPATPADNAGTAISRQGLTIETLPPTPRSLSTQGWERGRPTGLATCGAEAVSVVMYRDPTLTSRFLAFAYDPVGQRNLFVFSVLLIDEINFKHQVTLDLGQWKASRGTLVSHTNTTDGIGSPLPPPRPGLDDLMWAHAFHHHSIQVQIEQEGLP